LAWLGIPVCGDPLYPDVTDPDPADFSVPLALVARSVSFDDPVDGTSRRYQSTRRLR
jgi:tRNA pseudouridine32 synthase/23S rRNA pseudouridine746 synthase